MPWYYFYSRNQSKYKSDTFYSASSFAFSKLIEENFDLIAAEIIGFLEANEALLTPYFNTQLVNAPQKWKALSFYFWGVPMSDLAIRSCPITMAVFNNIPNIISASISIMEPGTEIKAHYGDTDAVYRCHLGIAIPGGLPECGFRVGYQDRAWKAGEILVFNDAAYHRGWNYTDKRRIILIFDVLRPEFSKQKKWICAMIRGHIYTQILAQKLNFGIERNILIKSVSVFFAMMVYVALLFRKGKN